MSYRYEPKGPVGRFVNSLEENTIAILLGLMTVLTFVNVILRYVFNAPLNGTILFVSTFYMVAIAFLPLALVEQGDNHISVELLFDRFPGGLRRALMILG